MEAASLALQPREGPRPSQTRRIAFWSAKAEIVGRSYQTSCVIARVTSGDVHVWLARSNRSRLPLTSHLAKTADRRATLWQMHRVCKRRTRLPSTCMHGSYRSVGVARRSSRGPSRCADGRADAPSHRASADVARSHECHVAVVVRPRGTFPRFSPLRTEGTPRGASRTVPRPCHVAFAPVHPPSDR